MATRIPPELLLHLMRDCILRPDDPHGGGHQYPNPWPYSQVCQYWRDTLISSPEFWTDIVLDVPREVYFRYGGDKRAKLENFVTARRRLQLERSKDRPLNIALLCPANHPAVPFIVREAYRWKSAVIRVPALEPVSFVNVVLAHCSNLESLTFKPQFVEGHFSRIQARVTVPKLRYLSMFHVADKRDTLLLALRLPALEELHVSVSYPEYILPAFIQASAPIQLRTLSLQCFGVDKQEIQRCLMMCSSQLSCLKIQLNDRGEAGSHAILDLLTWDPTATGMTLCPKLSSLTLINVWVGTDTLDSRHAFIGMLASRSGRAQADGVLSSNDRGLPATGTDSSMKVARPSETAAASGSRNQRPVCYLTEVQVSLRGGLKVARVFDEGHLARIKELGGFMSSFNLEDGPDEEGRLCRCGDCPKF